MKKLLPLFTFIFLAIGLQTVSAQVFKKADPIICPVDHNSYDTFVPPPEHFKRSSNLRQSQTANIIVNYEGFTEEAQIAFQYAVDIWASLIKSPVQIVINARFTALGEGVLGSASPGTYVRDFENAPQAGVFYPIALAEKLQSEDLNGEGTADINSNFNKDFDFYFGLDGIVPPNKYDFVSIVLHELGHGLGFTGGASLDPDNEEIGSWSISSSGSLPTIYTQFVELGNSTPITSLPDNSAETKNALTGNSLFFNGPYAILELGQKPKLYAPTDWNPGSSYSHLDEFEFPAGDPNSLMSPQFGGGEAIHDPGITMEIFADMGWIHTYLEHENNYELTENKTDPFDVSLQISSDTTLATENPVVIYSVDNFETADSVDLVVNQDGITFEGQIPNPGVNSIIRYYFAGVEDVGGRKYQLPVQAPEEFYEINIVNLNTVSVPYTLADGGDFESNPNDFQGIALEGAINLWELGTPENTLNAPVSGQNVWKTKLSENIGNEEKRVSSALLSPTFDFSDDTKNHELSFNFTMENAYREDIGIFESGPFGLQVQFSLDKGQSWELLGDINDDAGNNWYNLKESSPQVFPETSNAGWIQQTIDVANGDTTFIPINATYNVSFLTGFDQVNFRIVFYAASGFIEAGYEADGVLIDDFEILKTSPTAEFTVTDSKFVFAGDEIQFEYISTGATSFEWDFGDGTTSNLRNPTHVYAEGGAYTVSLTITSPDGTSTEEKQNYITVVNEAQIPYSLSDGGDLEGDNIDFIIQNVSGTGFELGRSTIEGKAGAASGTKAFVTGIDDSEYKNNSEAYIYTPEFNFESLGNYEFAFETNYQFEDNWDGFIVEYTLDRGDNWTKLNNEAEEGWYNQISDAQSVFGNQVPIFSGNTANAYERKFTDISFLGGVGNVTFRIKFLTDAAELDVGMAIDNFEILGPEPGPAIPDFSTEAQTACEGSTIIFYNDSKGSIKNLDWDFGSGAEPQSATGIGPHEVTYNNAGAYTVSLTATGVNDLITKEEKQDYILIAENHTPTISASEPDAEGKITLTASSGDAYQWFYKGEIVADAIEQELVVEKSGGYEVAVIIDGCEGLSENTVITSTESPLANSFSVYPNPMDQSKELNIAFENEYFGQYTIEVYSLTGRTILTENFKKNSKKETRLINLRGTSEGLYLIRVTTGDQSTQIKVLVE